MDDTSGVGFADNLFELKGFDDDTRQQAEMKGAEVQAAKDAASAPPPRKPTPKPTEDDFFAGLETEPVSDAASTIASNTTGASRSRFAFGGGGSDSSGGGSSGGGSSGDGGGGGCSSCTTATSTVATITHRIEEVRGLRAASHHE